MTMTPPPPPGKRPRGARDAAVPKPLDEVGRTAAPPASQRQATSDDAPPKRESATTGPTDAASTESPAPTQRTKPTGPKVSWISRLDDARFRGRIAMAVGILVIPLAVLGSGVTEYQAGAAQAGPPPTSTPVTTPMATVPPGDYTALCARLQPAAKDLGAATDLRVVSQVLLHADVDGYIAAAPTGFQPTLQDLKSTREAAATSLASGTGLVTQAQRDALPTSYLQDLVLLSLVLDRECH